MSSRRRCLDKKNKVQTKNEAEVRAVGWALRKLLLLQCICPLLTWALNKFRCLPVVPALAARGLRIPADPQNELEEKAAQNRTRMKRNLDGRDCIIDSFDSDDECDAAESRLRLNQVEVHLVIQHAYVTAGIPEEERWDPCVIPSFLACLLFLACHRCGFWLGQTVRKVFERLLNDLRSGPFECVFGLYLGACVVGVVGTILPTLSH